MKPGTVYLIGAGPGDPGLLTLRGRELLASCDAVVYDYLANSALLAHARPDAELIYVGKKGGDHTLPQPEITRLLIRLAGEGKSVARLKGGDPYLFGRGAEEAEEIIDAGLDFEVVPGVSSALAATAYAGIPLTHRAYASSVCLATGHEDPTKPESAHDWNALARGGSTLVFFMGMKNLPLITENLMKAGLDGATPAAIVRWGSTPQQKSLAATLAELPAKAREHGFSAPALIIIGKVAALRQKLAWFEKKPLLGKGVLVTRSREQASSIVSMLGELGAETFEFPSIRVEPCEDYSPLREALCRLREFDWVLFTSVNAVSFFWKQLAMLGLDTRALSMCRVAAVGPATGAALAAKGITADFTPGIFTAEDILKGLLAQGMKGQKILMPGALERARALPEGLQAAGAEVREVTAYVTRPETENPEALFALLDAGRIQVVSFASSSAVKGFLRRVPAEILCRYPALRYACIGPVTAKTLTDAGLECHIMPKEHTIPALVAAIAKG
ncbi:uroporphyrinogen-III C-methyltransferase [Desulfovibrio sp. OttesenSCG-928-I05]|nr:uroporphyrinogen-III C-methyltransferase [Desulfovibrio sp. OttesenSCG-928-I05]